MLIAAPNLIDLQLIGLVQTVFLGIFGGEGRVGTNVEERLCVEWFVRVILTIV